MPDDNVTVIVEVRDMADHGDVSDHFGALLHNQLAQSGNIAQNNFITVSKASDYDYLENKRVVNLDEALGAREVASRSTPGGPKQADE